jgi:hypothetical protein
MMRVLVAAFALLLSFPAAAQFSGGFGVSGFRSPAPAAAGGCSDADATAWSNAVAAISAPATPSANQLGYVCTLITAYKAAGVWTKLDREWLYASENATQASVDIVALSTHTLGGLAPTFTANRGYTTGGGSYIDTNYTPGTNLTLNSTGFGGYVRSTTGGETIVGYQSPYTYLKSTGGGTGIEYTANDFGFFSFATGIVGSIVVSRTSASDVDVYKNNSSTSLRHDTNAPNVVPGGDFFVGARNNGGSPVDPFDGEIASVFLGGGLTGVEAAAKNTALNAYMTSVGAAVY